MIDTLDISIQEIEESKINQIDFENILFARIYSDHMFVADFKEDWKDLRIVPYGDIRMSPATSTIHYGQSIFEGMKAYKNEAGDINIFRPTDNFNRFNISAERMCIPQLTEEIFMGGLTELLRLDAGWIPSKPGTSLYIRPFIFATDEYIGVRSSSTFRFMIITCPVGGYYSSAIRVKIETKYTRAAKGGTGYVKAAGNYAASLYPAKLAQDKGYHQLIWTDGVEHKYIEESGTMNIMFVINDTLVTPGLNDSILAGITRESVLTLARDWGMNVEERKVSVDEVVTGVQNGSLTEAFGVGTAATIAKIESIGYGDNDYTLPEEKPFSLRISKELEDIKRGKIEDKFDWIFKL